MKQEGEDTCVHVILKTLCFMTPYCFTTREAEEIVFYDTKLKTVFYNTTCMKLFKHNVF